MDSSPIRADGNLGNEAPAATAAKRTAVEPGCVEQPSRQAVIAPPATDDEVGHVCDPLDPNGW